MKTPVHNEFQELIGHVERTGIAIWRAYSASEYITSHIRAHSFGAVCYDSEEEAIQGLNLLFNNPVGITWIGLQRLADSGALKVKNESAL